MQLRTKIINKLKTMGWSFNSGCFTRIVYAYTWFYEIRLGRKCAFWNWPTFYKATGSTITIGDHCQFRSDHASNLIGVNHRCILSTHAKNAVLKIGDHCGFSGTSIGAKESIEIGNNVLIGANSIITDFDWHSLNPYNRFDENDIRSRKVVIEDNVWVGASCIILKGVKIGRNTIIGAGSIVTSSMPENSICGGNPCRVIKAISLPGEEKR
jgi:acetyltransferase-like isoleucine patch superfamily enzyme